MDNNKSKFKSKGKEESKNKSKDNYQNYLKNYQHKRRDKAKNNDAVVNNKKIFIKDLKDLNNEQNPNSNIGKLSQYDEEPEINNNLYTQLIEKEGDSYEELRQKNKKLRDIIIKFSKQLELLSLKYEKIKTVADNEKKILLNKLEKISKNYKLYAESYNENQKLKKEKDVLAENSSQINVIFNSCKNSLVKLIRKNMQYYTKLKNFYEEQSIISSEYRQTKLDNFIFSIKEEILNNLIQYRTQLDFINFPTFFTEYNSFINEQCNLHGYKNNNNLKWKKNKRNEQFEQEKENISYDDGRKYKNKNEKYLSINIKNNMIKKEKTPTKQNYDINMFKNNKNFNKTQYHNCFYDKNSSSFKTNTNSNEINFGQNGIFGDVGNIVPIKKRYSSRK